MPPTFAASRTQMILGLCVPLAVLIGYFLAEPFQLGSITVLGLVLATLAFPLVLRWHHPLLILSWNAAITPAFLPGSPPLWMLLSFVSFLLVLLNRSIREQSPILHVRSVTAPLVLLLMVVLITAACRGGIGIRTLGGASYGGRGYIFILASVLGYFALGSHRLRVDQVPLYCAFFFLAGVTALLPNLAYMGGETFWWLFYIVPPVFAMEQAMGDLSINAQIVRIYGFGPTSLALLSWLFARYGIKGIFVWHRPWRLALLVLASVACLYSGFRSILILAGLICIFQFWLEGLHRTRLAWLLGALLLLSTPVLLLRPASLPIVVQRTISFLPIDVNPAAKSSAQESTEWRFEMWRSVLPLVPRYLLVGKGYSIDPNELQMSFESARRGYGASKEAQTAGDYHSGPLSVVIPFGLWGSLAFLWFLGASIYYLYGNYSHGDPRLRRINTLLLALFLARSVFFLLVFGVLFMDLALFVGIVGFAVCLNGHEGARSSKPRVASGVNTNSSARQIHEGAERGKSDRQP